LLLKGAYDPKGYNKTKIILIIERHRNMEKNVFIILAVFSHVSFIWLSLTIVEYNNAGNADKKNYSYS